MAKLDKLFQNKECEFSDDAQIIKIMLQKLLKNRSFSVDYEDYLESFTSTDYEATAHKRMYESVSCYPF